ncbi:hypothetical protein GCM10010195_54750 [Kitasatospora griseola]|nr:hypothetical protein GCM10010195_54750 [Kitasatospora griseola]
MAEIVTFMKTEQVDGQKPIVTVFFEDYADRTRMRQTLEAVPGLKDLVFDPETSGVSTNGWPTLSAMRAADKRLLLFTDDHGTAIPEVGLRPGSDWTVENYWSIGDTGSNWDCYSRWGGVPLTQRNAKFSPLFVMNQFRNAPTIISAAIDNGDKLVERARNYCGPAARKMPNYVAVDFYEIPLGGATHRAIQTINRLHYVEGPAAPVAPPTVPAGFARPADTSVAKGYSFLRSAMNEFPYPVSQGLPRSYRGGYFAPGDQFGPTGFQSSFVYDDALMIDAFLGSGNADDRARAVTLGDALLYAQDHDPQPDGRLRSSYLPEPFVTKTGTPYIGGWSTYTGNMAWVGMAWSHLYRATGQQRYLDGARKAAEWIQSHAADSRGAGGYTGGVRALDEVGAEYQAITWKATEHNIDVGAFFAMLATLTGDQTWKSRSDAAFGFVRSMRAADGHLWTGTGLDGVSVNTDVVPADVQVWSYLATLSPDDAPAVDWLVRNQLTQDGPYQGVPFGSADRSKVWFEGTAQLLSALYARGRAEDTATAAALVSSLATAQDQAPNHDGFGIVAASRDGLDTGMGDQYYASLHTGATAWYLLAARNANPFRL